MEAFSAKFSTTPSGETMDWTQKCIGPKMMARTNSITCKIWWKSRDARLSERMKCDVFHFFIFENNARRPSTALVRVELLPKYIASAFLGRFRLYLRLFFGRKALSSLLNSFWNFRYDWCPNCPKKLKIWENGCKVCAHHFHHLEARWKKISITAQYPMYCRCALVKNISLSRYRVPQ